MATDGDAPIEGVGVALRIEPSEVASSPRAPAPPSGVQLAAARTPTSAHMGDLDALIAAARSGDTAAFRALYQRHRNDVARLVFRMLGARSDLEDVIQEVFFQVYRSLKDFRGQAKFTTWLHRVTVNVVLMHRRAQRSRPVYTEEPPAEVTPDPEIVPPDEDADRRERMRAFARLLDRLADKKRVVFVLHELEGVPPAEIAVIVGAPVLTVRTRLFYARRELETMLADEPSLAALKATLSKDGGKA
jgi:RNA polymerase sigma-70 factor (ECF subfamily)